MGGYFRWGQMIRSYEEELNGKEVSKFKSVFLSLTLTWVIDILFETRHKGMGPFLWGKMTPHNTM